MNPLKRSKSFGPVEFGHELLQYVKSEFQTKTYFIRLFHVFILFFRHPDWKDVPVENPIIIKKPPVKCPKRNVNMRNGSCFYRNVTYQDLDGMPSSDCCNSCFCDFGERLA